MAKEIWQLNVKVGLDGSGFQNHISSLNREMRKVQSELELATAGQPWGWLYATSIL